MGAVLVTIRVMPEGVESNLDLISKAAIKVIKKYTPSDVGIKKMPIAFGLTAIHLSFLMDDSKGGTEPIEKELSKLKGVAGVDVIEVTLI